MLDPRLQLMIINANREREIVAASRARLVPRRIRSLPRASRLTLTVGRQLVRLGTWLARPGSAEPGEHGEAA